ncbi:hypothetical protein PGUG_03882 [Meyerozyma guilliermondii ATCC 6260]|uniref:Myb-like domain-containing protein n=1 Tax=Meyerozyma guilliermondii (strain ATCC 6260 / CBS 566 / DSM 6381 / JCM 1539 / NBRC 10279 / NRRL Y-324) TaxID=294746 RepID=A5DKT1_PICGU|nr:uncharacterized protein PGUG_03882 [Meyerozyma guilliermondii ATCC 6260]EDK39784.2 hypothetical protein PGUG_03882 [Meyerozyma guilliermondii ATCC 6260]
MSSVVKKSLFAPKIKKNALRRKSVTSTTPLTPPATQAKPASEDTVKFRIGQLSESAVVAEEEALDPQDSSKGVVSEPTKATGEGESDIEEDYGENDIFNEPTITRRQSSVASQRRLSGITPPVVRQRLGSISAGPTASNVTEENAPPMRISIPVAKPTKRRRSSVAQRPTVLKTPMLRSGGATVVAEPGPNVEKVAEIALETGKKYVMGIDPKTNKLRKFRVNGNASEAEFTESVSEGVPEDEEDGEYDGPEKIPVAPKNLETRITSIKQLPRMIREEDIPLLERVQLDVSDITMADLCKPTLEIGQISENFNLVKAAQKRIRNERKQRRSERLQARLERRALNDADTVKLKTEESQRKKAQNELLNHDEPASQSSGLRLKLDKSGKLGVDEDSTIVNRHRNTTNSTMSREESNPFENPVTSSTYSRRKHTDRWTPDEAIQFYNALSTWGTDFTFIAQLFPYRTRKQIKSKFNLEEKKYPEIVELALKRKLPVDFEKYCLQSNNKIESLEYYNEQLRQVRVTHEEHMALIKSERERALKEDAEANRRREIEIRTGSKPMTRAEKLKELRKNEMVVGSIDDKKREEE